ncbi:hypothetical protein RchiOBHm_Chr5g0025701 [Rosa chinensis]|uniref:Uncharacterized protein n=1 Tax=Rosa chinensis TaxID=74649 RepID=A0A2P6Q8M5_ROSCH|nr:hypothetical protein RchiOBHm_Chr5g0025701 [Rosa chinensis]
MVERMQNKKSNARLFGNVFRFQIHSTLLVFMFAISSIYVADRFIPIWIIPRFLI